MKAVRTLPVLLVVSLLAGCSGGRQRSNSPAPVTPPPPAPVADVKLVLSTAPVNAEIAYLDEYAVVLSGSWTATNLGSGQVFLQASDSAGTFSMPAVAAAPASGTYSFAVPVLTTVPAGSYSGFLTVRACKDIQCVSPYSGASQSIAYTLKINPVAEWETLQRDSTHNGYVPIQLDPSRFAKAWEWQRPTAGTLGFINSVASAQGKVFVSEDEFFGRPWLYALDERDGTLSWKQQFVGNSVIGLSPPATSDGKVYVATTGHEDSFLWAFRAADGIPVLQASFQTQWANLLAPTVANGRAFVNAGYYGGVLYAYNGNDGVTLWSQSGGTNAMNTPAIDGTRVYSHNAFGLQVHELETGTTLATIGGKSGGIQTDYHGAPMLGSPDHVIAYKGDAFSGRASSSTESFYSRPLVNYSVAGNAVRWQTEKTYKTYPAVAKGVVYAASNNPKSLDALEESTGTILWSWVPGPEDTTFHRNIVVTNNLLFVSTNRALYAIDLATRQPVWQSPTPGDVAISASRMMYVATGTRESNGKLVAFRLR